MKSRKLFFFVLVSMQLYLNFANAKVPVAYDYDRQNPMHPCFLLTLISKMELGENVIFTKYGDGEYQCMIGEQGHNCDYDSYHPWLARELEKALISLCSKPNTYIGKWWTSEQGGTSAVHEYCNTIASRNGVVVPWAWYHLAFNGDEFLDYNYMYQFVKFIINTKRKKILVCNHLNSRMTSFFRADVYVEIPTDSWSFEYSKWKDALEQHLEKDALVLISAGLCSKVLINDITNKHEISCVDLGSSFDWLARRKPSRSQDHIYAQEVEYYKDFFPLGWEK